MKELFKEYFAFEFKVNRTEIDTWELSLTMGDGLSAVVVLAIIAIVVVIV